jgi:predicted O-methyltransferase YrrM
MKLICKIRKFIPSLLYFRGVNTNFLPAHFVKYLIKAKNRHGIHSAFVYEFYEKVVASKHEYYEFAPIEHLRKIMLHSMDSIEVVDFGAGSKGNKTRKIKDIARASSVSPKKGQLLFRLVNFVQPKIMVEMGTSLGISTLYQAKASPNATFITMEGSPQTAAKAVKNFELLKASNVKMVTGDFKVTLPEVLKATQLVDYVFFDGNHRKEATLEYFSGFLPKISDNTVFVFDDIRWSKGMYEAWKEIIKDPRATVTIDLFNMGIVFFRKGQVKEHFVLRY